VNIKKPLADEFLRESLERLAFQKYYRIRADAEMRGALIKFHKKHQRSIGWQDMQRAYPKIKLVGSKITAHLSWTDHGARLLVTLLWLLVCFSSLNWPYHSTRRITKLSASDEE
jgi:hypothetical protein